MRIKSTLLCGVAAGIFAAAALGGGVAEAKVAKADQTQAQIDDLRAQIQFLKDRLDEQAAISQKANADLKTAQNQAAAAQAQAAASAQVAAAQAQIIQTIPAEVKKEVAANKPKNDKAYYKGISITMGGFAAAESVYRDRDETADIGSSYSKIPFATDAASHTGETHLTARQSRYSILAQGDVSKDLDAAFYGEFDFLGAAQTANSNQSNSYQPRIRNLYGEANWKDEGIHVLVGQNWSLLTLNSKGITPRNEVPPPTIDASYVPGFAWARQPQVRLVKDFNKEVWVGVSLENPQTTFSGSAAAGGVTVTNNQAPTSQYFNGTNYSLNQYPDVIGKVALEKHIGDHTLHAEVEGIFRSYMDRVNIAAGSAATTLGYAAGNTTQNTNGGGAGGSITFDLVPKRLDLQGSFLAGTGIGRYGAAGLPDTTVGPNGSLKPIPETMFLAGATLHATPQLDFYVFGGGEFEGQKTYLVGGKVVGYGSTVASNAGCITELGSCSAVTKSIDQIAAGFWDKAFTGPFGQIRVGLQYSYTERKTFNDNTGFGPKVNENMVFTSFRYYPF